MTRRAIVTYVEGDGHLLQQLLALRRSWLALRSNDTDLVAFGPADIVNRLPADVVRIPQPPVADDPVWRGYRYANSIACLNGAGSERLTEYSHLLRSDVDTFVFGGWNQFYPGEFRWGTGAYANNDEVRDRIAAIADQYGLTHRGRTNVGSTWYGSTDLVRRTAAFAEMLTRHLVADVFAGDPGAWPGWYQGVSLLYAAEIAVNHCVVAGRGGPELDGESTSEAAADDTVHVHCWHTDRTFSKHQFMARNYSPVEIGELARGSVARRCLEHSFESLVDLRRISEPRLG